MNLLTSFLDTFMWKFWAFTLENINIAHRPYDMWQKCIHINIKPHFDKFSKFWITEIKQWFNHKLINGKENDLHVHDAIFLVWHQVRATKVRVTAAGTPPRDEMASPPPPPPHAARPVTPPLPETWARLTWRPRGTEATARAAQRVRLRTWTQLRVG